MQDGRKGDFQLSLTEETLPDAIFVHGDDGRLVAVNRQACTLTGYSREELLRMAVVDIEMDYDAIAAQAKWRAMPADAVGKLSGHHRRKDGTLVPVEIHVGVQQEGDGRIYVGVVRDISERLRQEAELREARERLFALEKERRERAEGALEATLERYRAVFDHCLVAIVVARVSDGAIVEVNDAFVAISGYNREEVLGKTTQELDLWGDPEDRVRFLQRVGAGESVTDLVTRFRRKDGEIRKTMITGKVVRIGTESFMVGQVADTVALSDAKAALVRERKLVQAIVDHSPNGLLMLAEDGRNIWHNARLEELLEYPPGLLRPGVALEEVVRFNHARGDYGGETYEQAFERTKALQHAKAPVRYARHARGGTRMLEVEVIPMPGLGHLVSYADVTERRLHEQKLESLVEARTDELRRSLLELELARDAALAASRAKSVFLTNMGHELRTPLNGILGMALLLKRTGLSDRQEDLLAKIEQSGRRLTDLLVEILDLSQLETGGLPLASEAFHLTALRAAILDRFEARVAQKQLGFGFDIAEDFAGLDLRADALRLEQVLAILVDNAIKFTEAGGVSVAATVAESRPGSLTARFEVKDTGIGIAPEQGAKLFQAFQQLDDGATRRYGGTGMGLAIAKRLAALMGGDMGYASEPGRGSTFWFTARLGTGEFGDR